ncbi:2'-5' RNA ligase family protein [Pseudonocardia sp. KRD291]|uniref:2'-5' RNA ligase family protein n=1 Tax=Pseudonocardia sp. KRD291 TaxID=2792007 RepID=UPI001C4A5BAF|nr:2'-5' RNA ligase family protein [Pseudonocardia sp. KRD291]MBW0105975.1 2'-5' RNA ligase family protein [Pseudonocardia sp. KRD291]
MRLFTALWPPPDAVSALRADVAGLGLDDDPAWRRSPTARWHVTLAFHGEDEPGRRARELQQRAAGAPAPRLRIAGTGEFPGVLWAGVEPAGPSDADALAGLVALAGGAPDRFVAHLTLARAARRRGRAAVPAPAGSRDLPAGPWWTPSEVLLVASRGTRSGLVYEPVHRVALGLSSGVADDVARR